MHQKWKFKAYYIMNIFLLFCSIVCVCVFPLLVYILIYVVTLELLCGIHTVVSQN